MAVTYKLLLCGKNQLIIDEFYEHMERGYDLLTASPRFSDLVRHIELFRPDMVVYCLYNETSSDYDRARELAVHLQRAGSALAIAGSKEDCDDFMRHTGDLADMVLPRPLKYEVIRGNIYAFMLDRDSAREEAAKELAASEAAPAPAPAPAAAPRPQPVPAAPAAAPVAPASSARKHILVIDDDPLMLKLLKEYLHESYDVATAVSGKIAYKFLESKTTDMVLLDYEMPGESGPEVFMNLRTRKTMVNTPIVFLTGVTDSERVKEVVSLKPQGYLLKPVDKEKLLSKVRNVLGA